MVCRSSLVQVLLRGQIASLPLTLSPYVDAAHVSTEGIRKS